MVGSLGSVLVVICAYGLKQAVSRHGDSNRIVSLAVASRDLTDALVVFRLERGGALSNLSAASPAPDDIMSAIVELRGEVTKNYAPRWICRARIRTRQAAARIACQSASTSGRAMPRVMKTIRERRSASGHLASATGGWKT